LVRRPGVTEIQLTQANSGQTVQARTGDVVVVRLAENPTTGYRWTVTHGPAPSDDTFSAAGGATGAGGERVLRFTVTGPMTTQVRAVLRRQWETDAPPQARFEIAIDVQ
jgi:inhibitor of cysteine peptidase